MTKITYLWKRRKMFNLYNPALHLYWVKSIVKFTGISKDIS